MDNMKATCTKNWENTRFLKRFGKIWKATWTQHESNMHKNLRKHQVLETFWKDLENNMDAT